MPLTILPEPGALRQHVGREVALSEWVTVTQQRIDRFAEATGDRQWIHTDPERASQSPFGGTIAHGFLTLAMVSALLHAAVRIDRLRMAVNYGLNRVRFITPVPSGAAVRGRFVLAALDEVRGAVQATWSVTVEMQGHDRPAAVIEWLTRYYPVSDDARD